MDTTMADDPDLENRPRKKVKVDDSAAGYAPQLPGPASMSNPNDTKDSITEAEQEQTARELAVGIEAFVSDNAGFQGVLKQRYHDFLVNEIMLNGKVVRLDDPEQLKTPTMFATNDVDHGEKVDMSASTNGVSIKKGNDAVSGMGGSGSGSTNAGGGKGEDGMNGQALEATDNSAEVSPELQFMYDLSGGSSEDPTRPRIELTDQNFEQLQKYFDMDGIKKLANLFREISEASRKDKKDYGFVDSLPVDDKDDRKTAHQIIRTVFLEQISSAHQDGNIVRCTPAADAVSRKGKSKLKHRNRNAAAQRPLGWDQLGGDYMHFTLYKENRDSGDILGFISSKLGMKGQKAFDMAGNKDRRAVTVQRVSAYKVRADRFLLLNNVIKQAHIGDCCYSQNKLQLGDLAGNEFLITLRDCTIPEPDSNSTTRNPEYIEKHIKQSMQNLRDRGFLNYYGLQRFGTFASRTDIVGQHMLKGDYKAAVDTILEYSPNSLQAAQDENDSSTISTNDKNRAQAIHWFLTKSASATKILETLPRRFTAEYAIVSFLLKSQDQQPTPHYRGALECIPRHLRNFYPHAYQSLIWNLAATHRWNLSPGKLLPGDLILTTHPPNQTTETTDTDPTYTPSRAYAIEHPYALTQEDIATNTYTIFDIVLPLPGHNVTYPTFMLPLYHASMQAHGDLDPEKMHRNWRDTSLPGSYRKLLGRPGEGWACEQVWYHEPDAKIALTDWERLEGRREKQQQQASPLAAAVAVGEEDSTMANTAENIDVVRAVLARTTSSGIILADNIPPGDRLAIVLRFQLQSSTYATMALRELMKTGPVEYKPDFSGGRGL